MIDVSQPEQTADLKACCATLYESDLARLLFGDTFHPGGLALTERLGELLDLQPGQQVLDVAAGNGTSAIYVAQRFGCEVVGVDFGLESVRAATARAEEAGLRHLVRFEQGDAEGLHFAEQSFDAVLCECAFCTFPNKTAAAGEFSRVLRPNGRVGLSDLTRFGPLPAGLEGLLAWIACVADARPVEDYISYLEQAHFRIEQVEPHNAALAKMIRQARTKFLGAEVLVKLKKLELLPGFDFDQAKTLARYTTEAVKAGQLGYAVIIGTKLPN